MRASPTGPAAAAVTPVRCVVCILALDLIAAARSWPIPVAGLLDEPAHVLTAWLALAAVGSLGKGAMPWALVGAVAIDVDHIPLYLWHEPVSSSGGRPVTHSLATIAVLLLIALAVPRCRTAVTGLAAGVLLHLTRDVATGPGIPALWPLRDEAVVLPYAVYAGFLAATATVATVRRLRPGWFARRRRTAPDIDRPESAGPASSGATCP
jgi:inner membrane protein